MEIIKEYGGISDWHLEIQCTGSTCFEAKPSPCYSILQLDSNDIVKAVCNPYPDHIPPTTYFGFVCCKCHTFTVIPSDKIPNEIRQICPKVDQSNSLEYEKLSAEEKELSKKLLIK